MKQVILTSGLGIALAISATTSFAGSGIILTNKINSDIKASCKSITGTQHFNLPVDVKKNSSVTVPWFLAEIEFNYTHNVSCTFIQDNGSNKPIASAEIDFNPMFSAAKITNVNQIDPQFKITISPEETVSENISVMIEQ